MAHTKQTPPAGLTLDEARALDYYLHRIHQELRLGFTNNARTILRAAFWYAQIETRLER